MNKSVVFSAHLYCFFIFIAFPVAAEEMILKEPPKSLSKYYPPESQQSKWIQQMHKMSSHFGGVFLNLKEKDFENVDKLADKLVKEYKKTQKVFVGKSSVKSEMAKNGQ